MRKGIQELLRDSKRDLIYRPSPRLVSGSPSTFINQRWPCRQVSMWVMSKLSGKTLTWLMLSLGQYSVRAWSSMSIGSLFTLIKQDTFSVNLYPAIFGFQDFTHKDPEPLFLEESLESDFYDRVFFHRKPFFSILLLHNINEKVDPSRPSIRALLTFENIIALTGRKWERLSDRLFWDFCFHKNSKG